MIYQIIDSAFFVLSVLPTDTNFAHFRTSFGLDLESLVIWTLSCTRRDVGNVRVDWRLLVEGDTKGGCRHFVKRRSW